jgi:hypothetical protein
MIAIRALGTGGTLIREIVEDYNILENAGPS